MLRRGAGTLFCGITAAVAGRWAIGDAGDLHGRTAVVTGANSGVGYTAALALARHGASVVLACRRADRAARAIGAIRAAVPAADVAAVALDLADLASVRQCAAALASASIDLLVNNAGVMAVPRAVTSDGFELQLATDHLGHFALTGLLLPALLRRPRARVVTVSSVSHVFGRIDFDDLQREQHYRRWAAYAQAKLSNLLFAFELDRRAKAAGSGLISVAAHPGYAATNILTGRAREEHKRFVALIGATGNRFVAQSAAAGALPTLFAGLAPGLQGGEFIGPRLALWGRPALARASRAARDAGAAARLWDVSEQLTGIAFEAFRSSVR